MTPVDFQLRPPATDDEISAVERAVGIELPSDYIEFLRHTNGGCGLIGSEYLDLGRVQEIPEIHAAHAIGDLMPGLVIVGSNGGGEAFGFDMRAAVYRMVMVPWIGMEWETAFSVGATFSSFLRTCGAMCRDSSLLADRWYVKPAITEGVDDLIASGGSLLVTEQLASALANVSLTVGSVGNFTSGFATLIPGRQVDADISLLDDGRLEVSRAALDFLLGFRIPGGALTPAPPRTSLADVVRKLSSSADDSAIYVVPEWTAASRAIIARADDLDDGELPAIAQDIGATFVIDVPSAKSLLAVAATETVEQHVARLLARVKSAR